jgi:hypothetical protein
MELLIALMVLLELGKNELELGDGLLVELL